MTSAPGSATAQATASPATGSASTAGRPRAPRIASARTGRRIAAYLLDLVCLAVPAALALLLLESVPLAVVLAVETLVGYLLVLARTGATPGTAVLGLRVARADRPYAPGLGRAAARVGLLVAAHLLLVAPVLLLLLKDRDGRYWHDARTGTRVVAPRQDPTSPLAPPTAGRGERRPGVPAAPGATAPGAAAGAAGTRVPPVPGPTRPGVPARPGVPTRPVVPPRPGVPQRPGAVVPPVPGLPGVPGVTGVGPGSVPASAAPWARPPAGGPDASVSLAAFRRQRATGPQVSALSLQVRGVAGAHRVTGSAVLGRRPDPAGGEVVVVLPDPDRQVSRTHAYLRLVDGVIWLQDAGSTNGCVVRAPDGSSAKVVPGSAVRIFPGGTIEFGRVVVEVQVVAG